MIRKFHKPHVFGSASLELLPEAMQEKIHIHPPVRKGNLVTLCQQQETGTILIVDGLFGNRLAIAPAEIRFAMESGWQVYGAASMGAMRAAELWPVGMIGLGDVYNLLRTGSISSDADMAVMYLGPELKEVTLSMVHIRFLLNHMRHGCELAMLSARKMKQLAQQIYWAERSIASVISAWRSAGIDSHYLKTFRRLAAVPCLHPKKRDGYYAVATLLSQQWMDVYDLHLHNVNETMMITSNV